MIRVIVMVMVMCMTAGGAGAKQISTGRTQAPAVPAAAAATTAVRGPFTLPDSGQVVEA